ncbi:unnamed protein product [Gongylonema pulchrum]|uniref:Conjugal transfer protein TraN n=1 Tax=Gongylonema pulchrum TaxID=637853 RepID=A0A183DJP6_9BILA|nr:unnamed protein product [Gongylonema pulchrum]
MMAFIPINTRLICYSYQRQNRTVLIEDMDDCLFAGTCCYSADFTNSKTKSVTAFGGCANEYFGLMTILPELSAISEVEKTRICEEETCIERMTLLGTLRFCACKGDKCNDKGIDGAAQDYRDRKAKQEFAQKIAQSRNVIEKAMQNMMDG